LTSISNTLTSNIFFGFFNRRYIDKNNNKNKINKTYNKSFKELEDLQEELLIVKLII
jgi:hypothetical protein